MEHAHGVAAPAHAGEDRVGLPADHLRHLHAQLPAHHRVEIAHHHRIGVRARYGADDVEGALDVGHPVAHGFVERVLQRLRAALHRHHRGAQQLHAVDVHRLPLDVLGAHVHHALHAVARRHRGRGHAMLACAGLGDHARLAHAPGDQRLAHGVVDLVRAGVVEVFALEPDLRTAQLLGQALGVIDRAGPADVVLELVVELGLERSVLAHAQILAPELVQGVHQGLGDEHAAVRPEVAVRVRQIVDLPGLIHLHGALP